MDTVLSLLDRFKYFAMFGILFLCGLGLPIPEEVTLIGSGIVVGWGRADFLYASFACVAGILAGDSMIFGLGYFYGRNFLRSRPMQFILPPRRQKKVARFFQKHGQKTVFLARFFPGVRIGVYAYAGSQRMSWLRFLFLDLLGALISGPTSIWVGGWAARTFVDDPELAAQKARAIVTQAGHWIALGILLAIVAAILVRWSTRKIVRWLRSRREAALGRPSVPAGANRRPHETEDSVRRS